jgi:hypothetical protein
MGSGGGIFSRLALALVALGVLGSALAPSASATTYTASVELKSSTAPHRFSRTFLFAYGSRVSFSAFSFGRDSLSASYSGPGRASLKGVRGRFGRFGSVDLAFTPSGPPKRRPRPKTCIGGPRFRYSWKGTFHGSVRLVPDAGLKGFTARRARFEGEVATYALWNCGTPEEESGMKLPFDPDAGGVFVEADSCDGSGFGANVEVVPATPPPPRSDEPPTPAEFSAHWTRSEGPVEVSYSIMVEGGPSTAVFDDGLTAATFTPPRPFHGVGELARLPDGTWQWSGTLKATFAGRTVSLVGPGIEPQVMTYEPRPNTGYAFLLANPC